MLVLALLSSSGFHRHPGGRTRRIRHAPCIRRLDQIYPELKQAVSPFRHAHGRNEKKVLLMAVACAHIYGNRCLGISSTAPSKPVQASADPRQTKARDVTQPLAVCGAHSPISKGT
jgi:hypothetical protein